MEDRKKKSLGSLQVADNGREVLVFCWLFRHLSDKTEKKHVRSATPR